MADETTIPLIDKDVVDGIIHSPPFLSVEGIVNLRDALPSTPSSILTGQITKPLYVFRSGEPAQVTDSGKSQLAALGVKKVFDLRTEAEVRNYKAPPLDIDGVEVINCPILKDEAFDPASIAERISLFGTDEVKATITLYNTFLKAGGKSLELILRHLRDHRNQPCLIHCTAGKDRTGVFVAIIQLLLGVDDDAIVADYALTTYGLQPLIPVLVERFRSKEAYKNNWKGAMNILASKPDTFRAFLNAFREDFGGVEKYIKEFTTLNDDDLQVIRGNLLLPSTATAANAE